MTARILIGGDPGPAGRLVAEHLRRSYFCAALCTGEAATLEQLHAWRPDLVILESQDGALALCRRVRDAADGHAAPVILLSSGPADPAARLRALHLGAEDLLGAPIDLQLLSARIQALLRARLPHESWRTLQRAPHEAGVPADAALPPSLAGARVLVIDDDRLTAAAVQDALSRDGATPGWAASLQQAAALGTTMAFDLVLLRLALLTDDPLRIVSELRAAEATREVPLLLLAQQSARSRLVRSLGLGADDWMVFASATPDALAELRARAANRLRQKFRLDRLRADLVQASAMRLTDALTGCYNRRYLRQLLSAAMLATPARRVAVLLLGIDGFRSLVETLGYAAGDAALVVVAATLRQAVRGADSVGRLGGDAFVVVMPDGDADAALATAEQLRSTVAAQPATRIGNETVSLTLSVGLVTWDGPPAASAATPERLLQQAGRALAAARARGGDTVSGAQEWTGAQVAGVA